MIKRLVAALMLSAMFASPTWADFKDGIKAFRAGNYALAAENWQPLANAGDPRAQTNLGLLYLRGKGVEKDGKAALSWFERAAEQEFVTAEYNLATLFAKGITVEKDQTNAATWYLQAAEHGHIRAQFEIARRYAEGNGIQYDEIEAYKGADAFGETRQGQASQENFRLQDPSCRGHVVSGDRTGRVCWRRGERPKSRDHWLKS